MKWVKVGNMLLPVKEKEPTPAQDLINALKDNPAPAKVEGDKTHKFQELGIEPTSHLSMAEKEAIKAERRQADQEVLNEAVKAEYERQENGAKVECENLSVYINGRIDHVNLEKLRSIIVKKDGDISWIRSLAARNTFIHNLENERNSKPQPPVSDYDRIQFTYRDGKFILK